MILIPGSLSFAKLVMMSFSPERFVGGGGGGGGMPDAYTKIHSLSHTILTPICIRSTCAFFLHGTQ